MDYVVKMMLADLNEKEIRAELDEYLSTQKQSGGIGERGKKSYIMAFGTLASWFAPSKDLAPFVKRVFELIQNENPINWLPYHWAVISVSYPFWLNVAKQIGRLFNLQNQVRQAQIISRLKEHYGDRETVSRCAIYVIRSLVAWGVLDDTKQRGYYEQPEPIQITDPNLAILLYESLLHTERDGKATLEVLKNNPALYPFKLPALSGDYISSQSKFIDVFRYGLDEELLILKPLLRTKN